jgi:hypothetical protein
MPTVPDAVFIAISSDSALALQAQLFDAGIRPDKGTLVVNQNRRALQSSGVRPTHRAADDRRDCRAARAVAGDGD